MKDEYNPLALGILQDSVGFIPAGPRNPEIYYTDRGELAASITLLTYLLMKKEVVEHINARETKVIAALKLDDATENILNNLKEGLPVGTMRDDAKLSEEEKLNNLGRAYRNHYVIQIHEDSGIGHVKAGKKTIMDFFASVHSEFEGVDVDDIDEEEYEEPLFAEEDHLYSENYWRTDGVLKIQEVLSAVDDPDALAKLMERVQSLPEGSPLRRIPSVVCHETAHLHAVAKAVIYEGLAVQPEAVIPDFKRDDYSKDEYGGELPPQLVDYAVQKAAKQAYHDNALPFEFEMGKFTSPKNLGYFFTKTSEAEAELLGSALLQDIEDTHGVDMYKSGIHEYMPDTYAMYQKLMARMKSPEEKDFDFDPEYSHDPDREMAAYADRQSKNSYDLK